jgi:hypothetical protein
MFATSTNLQLKPKRTTNWREADTVTRGILLELANQYETKPGCIQANQRGGAS